MRFASSAAIVLVLVAALAGCTVPGAEAESAEDNSPSITPTPTADVEIVDIPGPAAPTPPPVPMVYVTSVDLLGEGAATIIWNVNGTQNKADVTLPYSVVISSGETARVDDPYVAAGAVANIQLMVMESA